MSKLLCILLFLLSVPVFLQAQERVKESDSLARKPGLDLPSLSKIEHKPQQAADTLRQLTSVPDSLMLKQKMDSLRQLKTGIDTLMAVRALDSLQQLNLPTEILQAKEDSIRQLLSYSDKLNKEIQALDQRLNKPLHGGRKKLQAEINKQTGKPEGMNEEALGTLKEQTGVKGLSADLPQAEGISLKRMGIPANGLPEIKGISMEDVKATEIQGLSADKIQLPEIKGLKAGSLKETTGGREALADGLGKAGEFSEDLSHLAEGKTDQVKNVDKLAEEQFMKREETAFFQQQAEGAKQPAKDFLSTQSKDQLKQKSAEAAPKAAIDHFAGHKDKLQAAKNELSKHKNRFQNVKSVKELPKNPLKRNPLKGKPWPERWILGSVWQFHKQGRFRIDLGPSLAYRVSDKIEIGAAYQWRLTVDKKAPVFLSTKEWVSGYSVFADYRIKKGFFIRGSVAHLNLVPQQIQVSNEEDPNRIRVKSYALGAGKSYTFFKSLKGYSIIQYSFSEGLDKPYKNPLQVKIGFYINGKHFFKSAKEKDKAAPAAPPED